LQREITERWSYYEQLAGVERRLTAQDDRAVDPAEAGEEDAT
jgi:hypothetical protein